MNASERYVGLLLNYRDADRSASCIRSLQSNGILDVVVWDNSADERHSATTLLSEIGGDERIRVHVSPQNLGFAAGVNHGLELCEQLHAGARVLLINNDARLLPGALAALANALERCPEAKIAFPAINQAGVVSGLAYYHRLTGILYDRPRLGCFPYASGCCLLLATERLVPPLFDEDFFMYGEDAELGWRLQQHSPHALAFVDQVLVEHDGSASSGLGSAFYETHMVAAHLILVRKLAGKSIDRAVLFAFRVPILMSRACARALRFHSTAPLTALLRGAQLAFARKRPTSSVI